MPTDVTLETSIETANSAKSLRELSKGLKDLIGLQSQVGSSGSADFKKLQEAINKTEGKLGDLKDSFGTLRGNGIERVNSSLSLFREGLANADTDKLKIALQGIGSAMKAIPIFLLIEGVRLLFENFDKLYTSIKTLTGGVSDEEVAVSKLNKVYEDTLRINTQLISDLENQIKLSVAKKKPLEDILALELQTYNLKIGTLEARAAELRAIAEQQKSSKSLTETFLGESSALGILYNTLSGGAATRVKTAKETTKELAKVEQEIDALIISKQLERIKKGEEIAERDKEQRKKELEAFAANLARRRELSAREAAAEKQQAQDLLDFQIKEINKKRIEAEQLVQDEINSVKNAAFLKSIDVGKYEYSIEQQELQKSLDGRIELIEKKKREELAKVKEGGDAALIIEKNASQAILAEKLKAAQQYVSLAQNVSTTLNSINTLLSQNENYRIQQDGYIKDAELENSKNRNQEQIDNETLKTNKLLNNENLTENEREKIKYESETRQRQIDISAKNAQISIQRDYDKKSLEIRRTQFEREKKIQLVTASINTAAAIVSALGTVTPYPLALVAAAGAAIAGGLQIAQIASKKFDDGGAAARSSVAPIGNIDTRGGSAFTGAGSSAPNSNPSGNVTGAGKNNGQIKVVVLDADIRGVASRVDVLEDRATFG